MNNIDIKLELAIERLKYADNFLKEEKIKLMNMTGYDSNGNSYVLDDYDKQLEKIKTLESLVKEELDEVNHLKEMEEGKKYELTENTKEFVDVTFFQIRALKSFGDVKKGDLGGWIEKEENLSQEGDCWVYDRAQVRGNARVYDNAKVCEDAWVGGNAQVYGNAKVYGETRIYDNARIYGYAQVYDNSCIYGNAQIYGNAKVYECADVYEEAWVCGNACAFGNARVCKDACITRNAKVNGHRLPGLF